MVSTSVEPYLGIHVNLKESLFKVILHVVVTEDGGGEAHDRVGVVRLAAFRMVHAIFPLVCPGHLLFDKALVDLRIAGQSTVVGRPLHNERHFARHG